MRIHMERAMTEECSGHSPCALCEASTPPRSIVVSIDPYAFEICGMCAEALLGRKERGGVEADWPTLEGYREALKVFPEPMMTEEECERAEELGLYDDLFNMAQLH